MPQTDTSTQNLWPVASPFTDHAAAPLQMTSEGSDDPQKLKILWAINLDHRSGIRHGANLRYFNYSKELVSRGHEVYYLIDRRAGDDSVGKRRCLDDLKKQKVITDYFETYYQYPKVRGKVGHIVGYPSVVNRLLRKYQKPPTAGIKEIIRSRGINLCIFSDRRLLFVLPELNGDVRTIIDWVDSYVLYRIRETAVCLKTGALARLIMSLRYLVDTFMQERYYGRRCDANIVVSPVDKRYIDFVNGAPEKNRVLLNGVEANRVANRPDKVENRIIFTGNMDFPPNHDAAIWFIDHVLPLLLKRRSDIKFVIAGANPVEAIRSRAGANVEVTGFVEDMGHEIAKSALYAAPLVSGGGFKNKVVEAIANGTFVVATRMAVEFLDPGLQQELLVADTPEEMAHQVLSFLDDPRKFDARLERLGKIIAEEFEWGSRTQELIRIALESSSQAK